MTDQQLRMEIGKRIYNRWCLAKKLIPWDRLDEKIKEEIYKSIDEDVLSLLN